MNQTERKRETILFLIREARKLAYSGFYGSEMYSKLKELDRLEDTIEIEIERNNWDELESALDTIQKVNKAREEIKKNKAHAIRYVKDDCGSLSDYCKRKIKFYK